MKAPGAAWNLLARLAYIDAHQENFTTNPSAVPPVVTEGFAANLFDIHPDPELDLITWMPESVDALRVDSLAIFTAFVHDDLDTYNSIKGRKNAIRKLVGANATEGLVSIFDRVTAEFLPHE